MKTDKHFLSIAQSFLQWDMFLTN